MLALLGCALLYMPCSTCAKVLPFVAPIRFDFILRRCVLLFMGSLQADSLCIYGFTNPVCKNMQIAQTHGRRHRQLVHSLRVDAPRSTTLNRDRGAGQAERCEERGNGLAWPPSGALAL